MIPHEHIASLAKRILRPQDDESLGKNPKNPENRPGGSRFSGFFGFFPKDSYLGVLRFFLQAMRCVSVLGEMCTVWVGVPGKFGDSEIGGVGAVGTRVRVRHTFPGKSKMQFY